MTPDMEPGMRTLKERVLDRLLAKVKRFAELMDGIDDPMGEYLVVTQRRLTALEDKVERLERICASDDNAAKDRA